MPKSMSSRERTCGMMTWNRSHTGQHNINQRIQHHQKVKDENNALRVEVASQREQVADNAARFVL